jgi:hypothetical protein
LLNQGVYQLGDYLTWNEEAVGSSPATLTDEEDKLERELIFFG